jgi:hypothetical protein
LGYGITCATEDDPAKGSTDTRFSKAQVWGFGYIL